MPLGEVGSEVARAADVGKAAFSLNYTTFLNVIALVLAGWLYLRYRRTGGPRMMRMMERGAGHEHRHHGSE